ncbi:MAG: sulfotransferase [Krumholzibacteria bacterium]|nr:sulfotransferase [Candidatus Krumholzibacteria bacterium]
MRLASEGGVGFREAQAFRLLRLRKRARQFVKYRPGMPKTVLCVVGCQRSGTSMLHHLFRLDQDTVTYDEVSPLSTRDPERLRLDPREDVQRRIASDRAPFVVLKPLVESQNLPQMLDWFPDARAIWIYRDFRAVAASNLRFFGERNGFDDLAPILAGDCADWRAEHLAPADAERIRQAAAGPLGAHDAAVLFWWARNSLYFSLGLVSDPRVALCRYEDLVTSPAAVMRRAYAFVGRPYPGDAIVKDVFAGSKGRGRDLPLGDAVRAMGEGMLAELDAARSLLPEPAAAGR